MTCWGSIGSTVAVVRGSTRMTEVQRGGMKRTCNCNYLTNNWGGLSKYIWKELINRTPGKKCAKCWTKIATGGGALLHGTGGAHGECAPQHLRIQRIKCVTRRADTCCAVQLHRPQPKHVWRVTNNNSRCSLILHTLL